MWGLASGFASRKSAFSSGVAGRYAERGRHCVVIGRCTQRPYREPLALICNPCHSVRFLLFHTRIANPRKRQPENKNRADKKNKRQMNSISREMKLKNGEMYSISREMKLKSWEKKIKNGEMNSIS
jgi:hypothetical protein